MDAPDRLRLLFPASFGMTGIEAPPEMQSKERRPLDDELAALRPSSAEAGAAADESETLLHIDDDPSSSRGPVALRTRDAEPRTEEEVQRERDLYRRLLELASVEEIAPFLKEALEFVCTIAGAHQGYLELHDRDEEKDAPPRWWAAYEFGRDEVDEVRKNISRGIISAAIQSGEVISTNSALLDPRFDQRESVRASRIAAVLCAPIGGDVPVGVLYLQRRDEPQPFRASDRDLIEMVAGHLGRHADRLLARQATIDARDATRQIREQLRTEGIVGSSEALASVLREAAMVAPLDVSVLITGESGTGKSQVARIIHDNGPRTRRPLMEINCATIPETLIESELFGALPGSHSTARTKMEGKVAAAEGGTLFLDEVGELPLAVQAKLLQLLQSRMYYPLGSSRPSRADVRIIAATNQDLEQAVREHRFREDLFYRLQVVPIRMPRLNERREDIAELAQHFVEAAAERHKLPRVSISVNTLRALVAAQWPGNIRQLENVIEAATIRAASRQEEQIEVSHVFPGNRGPSGDALTFQEATRRFQSELLRTTLAETDYSVNEAARRLDLARSHVYNLIKAFGLSTKRKLGQP